MKYITYMYNVRVSNKMATYIKLYNKITQSSDYNFYKTKIIIRNVIESFCAFCYM